MPEPALHTAVRSGDIELVRRLVSPATINETFVFRISGDSLDSQTPLSVALNTFDFSRMTENGKQIIEILVNNGADINKVIGDESSNTPTFFLLSNIFDIDIFNLIINHSTININALQNIYGDTDTFLHNFIKACHHHSKETVNSIDVEKLSILLEKFDVNVQNSDGLTSLHLAANFGLTSFIELLIRKNADPTLRDRRGKTPLDLAVAVRHRIVASPFPKMIMGEGRSLADYQENIKLLEHYMRTHHLRKPAAETIGRSMFEWALRPPMSEENTGGVLYRRGKMSYEGAASTVANGSNTGAVGGAGAGAAAPSTGQGGGMRTRKRSIRHRRHRQRRVRTNKRK